MRERVGGAVRERERREGMMEGGIENSRLLSKNKAEKISKPTQITTHNLSETWAKPYVFFKRCYFFNIELR